MSHRLLVIEDVAAARDHLVQLARRALDVQPENIVTAATFSQARAAVLSAVEANLPFKMALIDIALPDGCGIDALRDLRTAFPETICIMTTVMAADSTIVSALAGGAQGYLLKGQRDDLIVRQLRLMESGVPAISPSIARRIIEHFRTRPPMSETDDKLTPRERCVLSVIAKGARVADAAREARHRRDDSGEPRQIDLSQARRLVACRGDPCGHADGPRRLTTPGLGLARSLIARKVCARTRNFLCKGAWPGLARMAWDRANVIPQIGEAEKQWSAVLPTRGHSSPL
ncbi:response regulator [Jiella pelagia]